MKAHFLTIVSLTLLLMNNTSGTNKTPPPSSHIPHTIRFFFKPLYQQAFFDIPISTLVPYLGNPQKLNRATIRQRISSETTSGIEVLYAGRITTSDFNGEVILPRLHDEDFINLIIVPRISPLVRHGVTVEYINLGPLKYATWYTIRRINDQEHNRLFWNIQRQPPQEKIPPYAIVILTEPSTIILEEGVYLAEKGDHLALPDIYVSPSMNIAEHAARVIPDNRFFTQTQPWNSHTTERYALIVT